MMKLGMVLNQGLLIENGGVEEGYLHLPRVMMEDTVSYAIF
jgi:hypothetical protein